MGAVERLARMGDRLFDRLRHKSAFEVTDEDAVDGGLESLHGHKYGLLVTFRRNGEAMPSPVWVALDEHGKVYVKTASHAGKVKRIQNDPRVLIAPADARGRLRGPAVRATARMLPSEEWPHAEATLAAAHGAARRISERIVGSPEMSAYIEIRPRS